MSTVLEPQTHDAGAPGMQSRGHSSGSRSDILAAAAKCFMKNGYSATSIDDVARQLDATKGMIYHHFRSKTDLFFAVYRRGMEINYAAVEPHVSDNGTALERLARMAFAHSIVLMAEQAFQRTLAEGVAMHLTGATTAAQRETLTELIDIRNQYEGMFRSAIRKTAKEEGLEIANLSLASKSFLAVLNSTVSWYTPRANDPQSEQKKLAIDLVTYALRGLGTDLPSGALKTKENAQ